VAKTAIATATPSQCTPSSTAIALGIPARTAPSSVGPGDSRSSRAVSAAQASQATGPVTQPQSSKKLFGNRIARIVERIATATS
jgi:hypothetical protein